MDRCGMTTSDPSLFGERVLSPGESSDDRVNASLGLRTPRGRVMVALMLTVALVAIDSTVVATVVPSVVGDLGGFAQFPWLFSAYVLTSAVTTPVFGRLADVQGRRVILLVGVGLFVLGSVLGTLAWSMPVLIGARVVQGFGAGAIQPVSMTVLGDLYSVAERARVQGYIAAVWAAASVIGPALGGLAVAAGSWRWVFAVNLPLGLVAGRVIDRSLTGDVAGASPGAGGRLDWWGAGLLMASSGLVIFALLDGGVGHPWRSPVVLGSLAIGGVLGAGFVVRQVWLRAHGGETLLPLWVLRHRTLVAGVVAQLAVGAIIIGISSYVPTFVQYGLGGSALLAGATVATVTLGWPLAAAQAGRFYLRLGFRTTTVIGAAIALVCALPALGWTARTSVIEVGAVCFVVGVGMGLSVPPTMVAIQAVVGWGERGAVTAAAMFARSLGSALGAAAFGALANATLLRHLAAGPAGGTGALPTDLDGAARTLADPRIPSAVAGFVRDGLVGAVHVVMVGLVLACLLHLLCLAALPRVVRTLEGEPVIARK